VVSGGDLTPAPADRDQRRPTLHKLQLISGRVLESFGAADKFGPTSFVDVAAAADSTVLVLDAAGHRVFRLRPKASELEVAAPLPDERLLSLAPASDNVVYVSSEAGIALVDLAAKTATPLKAAAGVDLAHVSRLRWHKGSLVGIQQSNEGYRAVRFALDRTGRRVTGQQILEGPLPAVAPTSATISGGVLYYLTARDGSEMTIRKITLP